MLRLTVLCENTALPAVGILGEHGFSALIETAGRQYLFDTGQGNTLLHNAAVMEIDLCRLDKIILSHGHFDHTGGLADLLRLTGPIDVHAHPNIFAERFAVDKKDGEEIYRSIGIPLPRAELESLGAGFVFNKTFTEIEKGLYLTGEAPRITSFEKEDKRLVIQKGGQYVQDTIPDDQSLIVESPQGLVVILGCAHSGIINILNHITEHVPGKNIHTVIGGTHIGFLTDAQIDTTIEHLKKFNIAKIGVSHCTGLAPSMKLMQAFGESFFFASAGSVIRIFKY